MKSVTLGQSLTRIEDYAFYYCLSLTSVQFPDKVKSIGDQVFYGCISLDAFTVSPSNPTYSSMDGVLFDKNLNTVLLCPPGKTGPYTIPNGPTAIGSNAFYSARISSVTIPETVTSIGVGAFAGCRGMLDVAFGSGITNIGENAFSFSGLSNVALPAGISTISDGAFYG